VTAPVLAYCTNIHPAAGLAGVMDSLRTTAADVQRRVAPGAHLPIGLRLSAAEVVELEEPGAVERVADELGRLRLDVVCANGFPFGAFHGAGIKSDVHRPDWRDTRRVIYSERLGAALARFLPAHGAGGVSTSPLSYRPWGEPSREAQGAMARNIARVAQRFARLAEDTGRTVHLDIEPEPDGLLETLTGFARWFEQDLAPAAAVPDIGLDGDTLRRHVRLCLDACHAAVMHEPPAEAISALETVGVRVGRVQVSSALRITIPTEPDARVRMRRALAPFAESTYLHQTVGALDAGAIERWEDLPEALAALDTARAREWRIHYHVPVFWTGAGEIGTTQGHLIELLREVRTRGLCRLFEIETYTWGVLPAEMRLGLPDSIAREMDWLRDTLHVIDRESSA